MAGLKVKAAGLVEMVVAMLILSISLSAAAITFIHFTDRSKIIQKEKIENELQVLENKILADSLFPENRKYYESEILGIQITKLQDVDSVLLVELQYKDSLETEISLKFIYAKD
jgi:type II secretory pathway component PulJ